MNVDQCKALGLIPYAVYGGKVESFKVREHAPETYGDPVLLKVLDGLLVHRDHAEALARDLVAVKTELDALKKQIAAGEPFDSDEIEAMNVGEIKMWLDSEYRWHVKSPERLPPGTYNAKVIEQPRFDNDGPWVDALSDAVAKARMVQPEEAVGKPTIFDVTKVDIVMGRNCNNCFREKSFCPYHVSGPMYGCSNWRPK